MIVVESPLELATATIAVDYCNTTLDYYYTLATLQHYTVETRNTIMVKSSFILHKTQAYQTQVSCDITNSKFQVSECHTDIFLWNPIF